MIHISVTNPIDNSMENKAMRIQYGKFIGFHHVAEVCTLPWPGSLLGRSLNHYQMENIQVQSSFRNWKFLRLRATSWVSSSKTGRGATRITHFTRLIRQRQYSRSKDPFAPPAAAERTSNSRSSQHNFKISDYWSNRRFTNCIGFYNF